MNLMFVIPRIVYSAHCSAHTHARAYSKRSVYLAFENMWGKILCFTCQDLHKNISNRDIIALHGEDLCALLLSSRSNMWICSSIWLRFLILVAYCRLQQQQQRRMRYRHRQTEANATYTQYLMCHSRNRSQMRIIMIHSISCVCVCGCILLVPPFQLFWMANCVCAGKSVCVCMCARRTRMFDFITKDKQ